MRLSIAIAAHNEGPLLAQTVESCVDACVGLDHEIVIVDDASTDGAVADVAQLFPMVRAHRSERRLGASAAKAQAARAARGDVLVFLDGHTKPVDDAVKRLVADVENLDGRAIVTPAVAALDCRSWRILDDQVGNGYAVDLLTVECHWLATEEMARVQHAGRTFYESPALIGCAFAMSRRLYDALWGFDAGMRRWGVEDVDLAVKSWLMGHPVLHDPAATVGHRFRAGFDNYEVALADVLHNQLRFTRKHLTHATWAQWVASCRMRNEASAHENAPEGFWAQAWARFQDGMRTVEQERTYLLGHRLNDEFWYARRFGLAWPALAGTDHRAGTDLLFAPASSVAPSHGPSGSPPPTCRVTGVSPTPATVILNLPQRFTVSGANLGNVSWVTSPAGTPATGTGAAFTTRWTTAGTRQVTASCGTTHATATATVVQVTGVLTPTDNFTGRSRVRFGVGETVNLSFEATPSRTAAQLGGLRWFIDSGGGSLSGTTGNDGLAVYTAPATAGAVRLVLKVASGPNAGRVVVTRNITVVEPNDALMVRAPSTGIKHTVNTWSVGFKGIPFVRPTDASFAHMLFGEGTVVAVTTGYCNQPPLIGMVHPVGALVSVGAGNATSGCQVNGVDTIFSGQLGPPFSVGDFLWAIPWEFSVGGSARRAFTTANHHATADAVGTATIAKKGAGPFSKAAGDPTSTF